MSKKKKNNLEKKKMKMSNLESNSTELRFTLYVVC